MTIDDMEEFLAKNRFLNCEVNIYTPYDEGIYAAALRIGKKVKPFCEKKEKIIVSLLSVDLQAPDKKPDKRALWGLGHVVPIKCLDSLLGESLRANISVSFSKNE